MTSRPHIGRRLLLVACLLVWFVAVVATHVPARHVPHVRVSDKALHVLGYFVLAGTFWLTLCVYGMARTKRVMCVFFAMVAYAAIDEVTQSVVGREPDFGDWLADVAGAAIALTVSELLALIWRR